MSALFPRETGLWVWVCAPLLAAVLLAPSFATLVGTLAVLAFFGAVNAARAGKPRTALQAGAVGAGLASLAGFVAADPWPWGAGLAGLLILAGWWVTFAGVGNGPAREKMHLGRTRYEIAAIVGAGLLGACLSTTTVSANRSVSVQLVLITWELLGLWWVRGQLARVFSRHPLPRAAALLSVGTSWLLLGAAAGGTPALVALPCLYAARVALTRPASGTQDARRLGLSEAAWTTLVVILAVLIVRVGP